MTMVRSSTNSLSPVSIASLMSLAAAADREPIALFQGSDSSSLCNMVTASWDDLSSYVCGNTGKQVEANLWTIFRKCLHIVNGRVVMVPSAAWMSVTGLWNTNMWCMTA
jgi:hypothetical protein